MIGKTLPRPYKDADELLQQFPQLGGRAAQPVGICIFITLVYLYFNAMPKTKWPYC